MGCGIGILDSGFERAKLRRAESRKPKSQARLLQIRRKISVPLVPPKPKPFDIATSTLASRATFGT